MHPLPQLDDPIRYTGLYVFDFGDSVAVGYTAHEVATLLESERYADGKVYKIHRAYPDGRLELKGVAAERFRSEEGLFFYRHDGERSRDDFAAIKRLAEQTPPPCRCKVHLVEITGATHPHAVALIYPAEFSDEISTWLGAIGYDGGDFVEGGISQVTDYYAATVRRLDQHQLWGTLDETSRPAEDVLATTHVAVQR